MIEPTFDWGSTRSLQILMWLVGLVLGMVVLGSAPAWSQEAELETSELCHYAAVLALNGNFEEANKVLAIVPMGTCSYGDQLTGNEIHQVTIPLPSPITTVCLAAAKAVVEGESAKAATILGGIDAGLCSDMADGDPGLIADNLTAIGECQAAQAFHKTDEGCLTTGETALTFLDRLLPVAYLLIVFGVAYYAAYWIGPFLKLMRFSTVSEAGQLFSYAAVVVALGTIGFSGSGATVITLVIFGVLALGRFVLRLRKNAAMGRETVDRLGWLLLGVFSITVLLADGEHVVTHYGWIGWTLVIFTMLFGYIFLSMAVHGDTPRLTIETWSDEETSKRFGEAVLAEIRFLASDETSGLQVSKPESTIGVPKAALSVTGAGGALASLADAFRPRRSYILHIDSIKGGASRLGVLGTLSRGWVLVGSEQIRLANIGYTRTMTRSDGSSADPDDLIPNLSSVTAAAIATWTLQQIQSEMGDATAIYGTAHSECAELTSAGARWAHLGYRDAAMSLYLRSIGLDAASADGSISNKTARHNLGLILMSEPTMSSPDGVARPALLDHRNDVGRAWGYFNEAFGKKPTSGVDLPLHLRALYNMAAAALNMYSIENVLNEFVTEDEQPYDDYQEMLAVVRRALSNLSLYDSVNTTPEEREFVGKAMQALRLVRQNIMSALGEPFGSLEMDGLTPFSNHIVACRFSRDDATFELALEHLGMAVVDPRLGMAAREDLCYYGLRSELDCALKFDDLTLPENDALEAIAIISDSQQVRQGFENQGFTRWRQLAELRGNKEARDKVADAGAVNPVLVQDAVDVAFLADGLALSMGVDRDRAMQVRVANLFKAAGHSDPKDFAVARRTSLEKMRLDLMIANGSAILQGVTYLPLAGSGRYVTWSTIESSLERWVDAAADIR